MSLRLTTQRPKSSQRRRCMLPSGGHWQLGCWDWARCLLSTPGIEIQKAAGLDLAEIHQGSCPLTESPQAPLQFGRHAPVRIKTCQCRQQPRRAPVNARAGDQQGAGDAIAVAAAARKRQQLLNPKGTPNSADQRSLMCPWITRVTHVRPGSDSMFLSRWASNTGQRHRRQWGTIQVAQLLEGAFASSHWQVEPALRLQLVSIQAHRRAFLTCRLPRRCTCRLQRLRLLLAGSNNRCRVTRRCTCRLQWLRPSLLLAGSNGCRVPRQLRRHLRSERLRVRGSCSRCRDVGAGSCRVGCWQALFAIHFYTCSAVRAFLQRV